MLDGRGRRSFWVGLSVDKGVSLMNTQSFYLATTTTQFNSIFFFREGESSSAWSRTMETEDNATAHHVPGLQPFTTYMFRVAARNALGFSKPSRESYPTMTHREREYH